MLRTHSLFAEKLAPIRAGTGDHGRGRVNKTLYLLIILMMRIIVGGS
jgi:hypothetical protein